jgi:hypothetical protein
VGVPGDLRARLAAQVAIDGSGIPARHVGE